jgi:hypothetical protein
MEWNRAQKSTLTDAVKCFLTESIIFSKITQWVKSNFFKNAAVKKKMDIPIYIKVELSWCQWLASIILAMWEAEVGRSGGWQFGQTSSQDPISTNSWVWWCMHVVLS